MVNEAGCLTIISDITLLPCYSLLRLAPTMFYISPSMIIGSRIHSRQSRAPTPLSKGLGTRLYIALYKAKYMRQLIVARTILDQLTTTHTTCSQSGKPDPNFHIMHYYCKRRKLGGAWVRYQSRNQTIAHWSGSEPTSEGAVKIFSPLLGIQRWLNQVSCYGCRKTLYLYRFPCSSHQSYCRTPRKTGLMADS